MAKRRKAAKQRQPAGSRNKRAPDIIPANRAAVLRQGLDADTLRYQRELLEQMQICAALMSPQNRALPLEPERRTAIDSILADWYLTLAVGCGEKIRPLDDIINEPDPRKRAVYLQGIISDVVNNIDDNPSDNVKRFLLHVAWHEGARLTTRIQGGGGPARSFYQFEAYKAREAMEYARAQGFMDFLVNSSGGSTDADLKAASDQLPSTTAEPYFPDGNLIKTLLETNDPFGTYLVRIEFKRYSAAIGPTNQDHTDYWYTYWKGTDPDPAGVKKQFLADCNEVDQLLQSSVRPRWQRDDVTIPQPGAPQTAQDVVTACDNEFAANSGLCNGFVIAVANDFAKSRGDFDGCDADKITNIIGSGQNNWLKLADGIEAFDAANSGKLVVAGALSTSYVPPRPHGHVVIVVSSSQTWKASDGKEYPYGYWGDIDGNPQEKLQLSEAFNHTVRDANKVVYACKIV